MFALAAVGAATGEGTGILVAGRLRESIGVVSVLTAQAVLYLLAESLAAGLLTDPVGQLVSLGHHDDRWGNQGRRTGAPTPGGAM